MQKKYFNSRLKRSLTNFKNLNILLQKGNGAHIDPAYERLLFEIIIERWNRLAASASKRQIDASVCMSNNQCNVSTKIMSISNDIQLIVSQQCKKIANSRKAGNSNELFMILNKSLWLKKIKNFSSKEEQEEKKKKKKNVRKRKVLRKRFHNTPCPCARFI